MVLSNPEENEQLQDPVVLQGESETLTCKYCGQEYPSTGKHDPGYCRECAMVFLSGPLDGKKVGEIFDNYRSEAEAD